MPEVQGDQVGGASVVFDDEDARRRQCGPQDVDGRKNG